MNTPRHISLRAMEPEDLETLYNIENDEANWAMSATNVPYSRYTLRQYIANAANDIYADGQVRLMIENEDKQVVGVIDLVNFDPTHQRAELGIIIATPFRQQGYGKAALQHLIQTAKAKIHLHQIYAYVAADNQSSINCLKSVGFQQTTALKQWFYYKNKHVDAYVMQLFL